MAAVGARRASVDLSLALPIVRCQIPRMTLVRVLVVMGLLAGLAGCNSDGGGSGGGSAFRNLGKRADSSLAGRAR
jgi:hypothetical protein